MALCKKAYIEELREPEIAKVGNCIAGCVLQYTILLELSRKKSQTEEEIFGIMKIRFDRKLNALIVKDSLDDLWFNQKIRAESRGGKCHFYLTDQGRKTLTIKRKNKEMEKIENKKMR